MFTTSLAACNSYVNKTAVPNLSSQEAANPDFTSIQSKIILPYCISCHGSGVSPDLGSYANVKAMVSLIYNAVVTTQSMPPGQPLTPELKQLLATWINAGAPEQTSRATGSAPAPSSSPLPDSRSSGDATFSSIVQNILQPKCVACHAPGSKTPVTNYDFLIKSSWVVAGSPQSSELYQAVSTGRMPPGNPLNKSAIATIETWITNGAKE